MTKDMAADEDSKLVTTTADQANITLIRTCAAVRATCHAHADLFLVQGNAFQFDFELIDDAGQSSFRLGEGQATGRDGRAGHAILAHERKVFRPADAELGQLLFKLAACGWRQITKEDVLKR